MLEDVWYGRHNKLWLHPTPCCFALTYIIEYIIGRDVHFLSSDIMDSYELNWSTIHWEIDKKTQKRAGANVNNAAAVLIFEKVTRLTVGHLSCCYQKEELSSGTDVVFPPAAASPLAEPSEQSKRKVYWTEVNVQSVSDFIFILSVSHIAANSWRNTRAACRKEAWSLSVALIISLTCGWKS